MKKIIDVKFKKIFGVGFVSTHKYYQDIYKEVCPYYSGHIEILKVLFKLWYKLLRFEHHRRQINKFTKKEYELLAEAMNEHERGALQRALGYGVYVVYNVPLIKWYLWDNNGRDDVDKHRKLLTLPIEDMPLYINEKTSSGLVARWRLKIGK